MSQTIESKNKALVLETFDTLFNKRDYVAAERYWSPNYIQHSAHIETRPADSCSNCLLCYYRARGEGPEVKSDLGHGEKLFG
jgi:hypothetical protein